MNAEDRPLSIAEASDAQLEEMMHGPRRREILDEVFHGMPEAADADRIEGVDAVIHWCICDPPDAGEEVYEIVIRGGEVSVSKEPEETPRVTMRVGGADFLKLVTGNQSGNGLFMAGKLKLEGDMMFAVTFHGMFKTAGGRDASARGTAPA
jgi:alkyl sulfatase BDS1-like metallo-beta-lactamase superfamily hydrolase